MNESNSKEEGVSGDIFSSQYIREEGTLGVTDVNIKESEPVFRNLEVEDIYGLGKPVRRIIRAKIIED